VHSLFDPVLLTGLYCGRPSVTLLLVTIYNFNYGLPFGACRPKLPRRLAPWLAPRTDYLFYFRTDHE
jgi:hypothetical protein